MSTCLPGKAKSGCPITFDPVLQAVLKQNGRVLFDSRAMPGEVVDVLVARKEALACCSERIEHLIKGQQKPWCIWLHTHKRRRS